MNNIAPKIQDVQKELDVLSAKKSFAQSQRVILSVIKLLDGSISENNLDLFQLFTDSDGKIRANASWFFEDQVIADRKATYKVHSENTLNIDFKVYGVNKPSKRVISWATALTPNFEDEPFNSKFNLGIDFIIPKSTDRVIIVLTNNYIIRTLELKGVLTATFQEILSKWTEIKDFSNKGAVQTALWESFDLQPLNKKFYAGISERFILLRQHLVKEKVLDEKHASMFANRLIGRVIFCWFLDKKDIINRDLKYFDSESFDDDTEYYKTKLEKLFFGVLNTPIADREYKDDVTPFLNGGLFEARKNDLYQDSKLSFPKNYFDDLFSFLSAYNFTTDESTSQFQQVAIDPEMLGRIFENLLAEMTEETGEQARKAKGAFYTPREIVDYMCKESLKEYLKTKLPEDTFRDQRLYQLIEAPDKDFQDQDHNWRRDWKPYKDTIITALDDMKILDPACGSGAFPIGMLQLLVRVYERLEARFDSYRTKLQVIENNIYGVDIEPMAVEIARLRTWLSIVVDEEADSKKIKPLPNLEFKFVCANSLIDLDQSGVATFGDDPDLENKLQDIRDAYFNTESIAKKKKLRISYDKLVSTGEGLFGESKKSKQLKTYQPFDNESSANFFNPEFMFGVQDFSIIIGNPPWVSNDTLSSNIKDSLTARFSYSIQSRFDLACPFIELALDFISNERSIIAYVLPEHLWIGEYFVSLRKAIYQNIKEVTSLKEGYFESVNNPASLLILTKQKNKNIIVGKSYKDLSIDRKEVPNEHIAQETLLDSRENVIHPYKIYFNLDYLSLKEKILSLKEIKLLGEICLVTDGVQTANVLSQIMTNQDPDDKSKYFKALRKGASIKEKYGCIEWDGWWILKPEYADQYKKPGYSYNSPKRAACFLANKKIILRQTEPSIFATIDFDQYRFPNSIFQIVQKEPYAGLSLEYILGLINSKLLRTYYSLSAQVEGTTKPQIYINILKSIPIKIPDKILENSVKVKVNALLSLKKEKRTQENEKDILLLEEQLDQLIVDIYEITDKEKDIVKNSVK